MRLHWGHIPAHRVESGSSTLDPLIGKLRAFLDGRAGGYVLDARRDGGGMEVLQRGIQRMIAGRRTAAEVARDYEAWVGANDSSRSGSGE